MFLGPVEIDFAGAHRLERALHSEGADIDVTEDQRDEQDRDDAVHDLRDLHSGDVGDVEWEQQQKAGERNRGTGAEDAQNTIFSPALNRRAGACFDAMNPPPCLSHSISTLSGMLSFSQSIGISMMPTMNGKLVKLCAYLAACENALKASGPINGSSSSLPKVMLRPEMPSTMNETAVSQCTNRSNELKRRTLRPERPSEMRIRPSTKYPAASPATVPRMMMAPSQCSVTS